MHEIEQRSVIGKGEHMLESGHPAAQSIEVGILLLNIKGVCNTRPKRFCAWSSAASPCTNALSTPSIYCSVYKRSA